MFSIVLAVLAAGFNAVSSVLQRKANRDEATTRKFGVGLLLHLITRPVWLFGLGAMIASFLLQATALGVGTLAAVEPVLVLELPLALILGAAVFRQRLQRQDWLASATMAAGLALLIAVLAPSGGDAQHVSTVLALLASAGTLAGVLVLVLAGHAGPARGRAALFGAAAGSGFGLTAGLMKLAVAQLSAHGVAVLFATWETYAMVAAGIASVGVVQAALNAGTLVTAQPGITLLDPLVSLLWGTIVTGEHTRTGPILVLAALGGGAIVAAAVWLARSAARTHPEAA
ncbi:MAG: DMT family transporter [Jatrophihabitans sp.]